MAYVGGGNLFPNWQGNPIPSFPNNQAIVNGVVVNLVPYVDLVNHGITSVTANTKTLVYTIPGTWSAGTYLINAEFQAQNTTAGQTAYATGDAVDWTVQGIGDASVDYAEAIIRPYYMGYTEGAGNAGTTGICKITPSGITTITANNTQIGIYVKYDTNTAGTINCSLTMTVFSIQKVG